ncbi:SdpI family protein [Microbacterium sp. G2-8]|uniref:SdpI family protein n=1 Tax=Microbacterium sp. G2-8 TaxID=2842454 RepID=UPI001C89545A|nr:SdpI family protein [Microbacterium sp. G2-8]
MTTEDLLGRASIFLCMTGSGLLILWMASATASGRLKRNPFAGIRTPVVMDSEETWRIAHVRAKRDNQRAGIAALAAGLFALVPVPIAVIAVGALVGAVIMLAFVLHGARVGGNAARAHLAEQRRDG